MITRWSSNPTVLRWLGLVGSVCCAIDGFLFGAPPQLRLDVSVLSILRGPNGPLIMVLWVVGLGALCTAWWYGRHLLGRGLLTHRWILVTAALWILPMLVIPPLASRDMYAYACQGALFDAGFNPYHDSVSTQPCPWLESVSVRWRDTPTPYGPVFVVLAGAAASLGSQAAALIGFRVLAVLSVVALAAALPVLARRVGVPVDRSLWLVICCPLVPVHLIGGGHNDATTVAFLVAGLACLAGGRHRMSALVAGGVLLGLSVSVKTTMGVVLPFAALLAAGGAALFPPGRAWWRPGGLPLLARCGATVIGTALATLVVASFASGLGLGWATALSGAGESVSWTSPPTAVGLAVEAVGRWFDWQWQAVPVARAVALALLPIVLVAILWRIRRHDPLYGAALACLAVIFLAPITQPWYLMWPLVLLVATTVRARWLLITIVISMFTILPDGDGALKPLQVPLSFLMVGLVAWVAREACGGYVAPSRHRSTVRVALMPRLRVVRYTGLSGGLLLALTAFLGGSGLTRGSLVSVRSVLHGDNGVLLPACWFAGTALLIGAWWYGRDVVPSTRWALVTAGLWWLPLLPFLPMGSDDVYSYACQGWVQYTGHDPYAAGAQQQGCPWISAVSPIWRESPAPYGPVFVVLAAAAVGASWMSLVGAVAGLRVIAVAGVLLIAVALPVLARRTGVSPARAVWLMLACPLVGVHLVSGAHNDALMVGLLVAGLAVVVSRPPAHGRATALAVVAVGGALLGLAVGVKVTAVVVLPFAVLMAVPPRSALRALAAPAAALGGGALGAMAVVSFTADRGLGWVRGLLLAAVTPSSGRRLRRRWG